MHGRDQTAADSVAAEIIRDGGKAMAATGDVTDFGQVESVRRQMEDTWGPVGILVANAGGSFTPPAPLEQIPEDGWRATVDGNLLATFLTLELPARDERASSGHDHHYRLGRWAARQPSLPHSLRGRQGRHRTADTGRRRPGGPVRDPRQLRHPRDNPHRGHQEQIPAELQASLADAHPLKRLGTPQDVATTAAFLVSDEAAWITGVVIDVAGGAVLV